MSVFIVCLYIDCHWRSLYQEGLDINQFKAAPCCARPKPGTGFPTSYVVVLLCLMNWDERWSFVLLMLVELLTIIVYNLFVIIESVFKYLIASQINLVIQANTSRTQVIIVLLFVAFLSIGIEFTKNTLNTINATSVKRDLKNILDIVHKPLSSSVLVVALSVILQFTTWRSHLYVDWKCRQYLVFSPLPFPCRTSNIQ